MVCRPSGAGSLLTQLHVPRLTPRAILCRPSGPEMPSTRTFECRTTDADPLKVCASRGSAPTADSDRPPDSTMPSGAGCELLAPVAHRPGEVPAGRPYPVDASNRLAQAGFPPSALRAKHEVHIPGR